MSQQDARYAPQEGVVDAISRIASQICHGANGAEQDLRHAIEREFPGLARFTARQLAEPIDHSDPNIDYARTERRDDAFIEALRVVRLDARDTPKARQFKDRWDQFITRGPWNTWRHDGAPDRNGSAENVALFWLTVHNRANSLSERHIRDLMAELDAGNF